VAAIRLEVRVERDLVLPGRIWCAPRPRALVAVVHGLGEHDGRYAALASRLVERRFTVAALDLPGHGEANGPRGDARSWELLRDRCVPATFTATRGIPGQPTAPRTVLLGHSMGGLLALDFALAHPRDIVGVVASAPAIQGAPPPPWKLLMARVARVAVPSLGFPHGLDESGMSRDPEVLTLRRTDPLVHDRISPRLYAGIEAARLRVLAEARRLAVPALLLHGMKDRVAFPGGTQAFHAAAPRGMAKLVTYPEAYHEIFNDLDRELVIRDLTAWLDTIVPE
jgi:alpha-beta hydrolase superfamily lysophospholipase